MGGPNAEQEEFWDRQAGPKWVRRAAEMDALLAPVLRLLLDEARLRDGESVLDVGCGNGTSTFEAAGLVGKAGHATGADISGSLLKLARDRAARAGIRNVDFLLADAETQDFPKRSFDVMISRFGVMFFDDSVAAFRNIARALRPGGRIVFAAWGQIGANPYFTLPAAVSRAHFGGAPPKGDPDGPGPFAFREPERILDILRGAGLAEVRVDVRQVELTPTGGPEDMAQLCEEIGPVAGAFEHFNATDADRRAVRDGIASALRDYERAGALRVPAEINLGLATVS
jgi:SAM-dependent methyltransferase